MTIKNKYNIDRDFADCFDEAIGMCLGQEIRSCTERYESGEQLASGGMKRIIITIDHITGRPVAKAIMKDSSDPVKVERFFHEARICASLEHPNIVPVYDIGYDNENEPFFTMKLIKGKSLNEQIKEGSQNRTDLLVNFLKICDAIAYAHSREIIHRDLKPDNIQISSFGEVLVCDWGLSRREGSQEDIEDYNSSPAAPVTLDGVIQGTPGYMSPEQARGEKDEVDNKSDIYSLGAILYFILAKQPPLKNLNVNEVIDSTGKGIVPSLKEIDTEIPSPLNAICLKAMSFKPNDRYNSAADLKKDVFNFIHGYATSAEEIGFLGILKLLIARNRRIYLTLITSILIIASLITWFIISLNLSREEAMSAKKVAETALKKFTEAEETKHKLTKDAAPKILERVHLALYSYEFKKGLEICNFAIDLDYNLLKAHSQKAYILLSLLRFEEALKEFKIAQFKDTQKAVIATKKFIEHFGSRKKFKLEDFFYIIDTYSNKNMPQMIKEQVFSPTMDKLSISERRQFAKKILNIHNPKIGSIIFEKDKVIINWLKLKDASGLYKTGISELNLKKAQVDSILVIKGLPVKKLILPLSNKGVIPRKDLLTYVQRCSTLLEIHVPRNFSKSERSLIPAHIKIVKYND